jgi:hypothetical protein
VSQLRHALEDLAANSEAKAAAAVAGRLAAAESGRAAAEAALCQLAEEVRCSCCVGFKGLQEDTHMQSTAQKMVEKVWAPAAMFCNLESPAWLLLPYCAVRVTIVWCDRLSPNCANVCSATVHGFAFHSHTIESLLQ